MQPPRHLGRLGAGLYVSCTGPARPAPPIPVPGQTPRVVLALSQC